MIVKVRPGVVLAHVCDQSLLVAKRETEQRCPYVTMLNETGETIWKCLADGKNISDIVQTIQETFDVPSDVDAERLIIDYIDQLHENGYVVYEED